MTARGSSMLAAKQPTGLREGVASDADLCDRIHGSSRLGYLLLLGHDFRTSWLSELGARSELSPGYDLDDSLI